MGPGLTCGSSLQDVLEDVLNFSSNLVDDIGGIVLVLGNLTKILEEDINIQAISANMTVSSFLAAE